jgi:hypothetical protein
MTHIALLIFVSIVVVALTWLSFILRSVFRGGVMTDSTAAPEDVLLSPVTYRPLRQAVPCEPAPRGSLPPANVDLIPMMVSEFCDGGEACILCPGNGCEHDCDHNGARIAGRNQVDYDLAHPKGEK